MNTNTNIMFISDNAKPVYQAEFIQIVNKHRRKEDIEYCIAFANHHVFEVSTNMEMITLQSIIWNKALKIDLEETSDILYLEICLYRQQACQILEKQYENDIVDYHRILTVYNAELLNMKIKSKRHIDRMNQDYPLYSYGFGHAFYRLSNSYYDLKNLYNIISIEMVNTIERLNKHRRDALTTTTLCFRRNFALPFNFNIEERAFIMEIESYLF